MDSPNSNQPPNSNENSQSNLNQSANSNETSQYNELNYQNFLITLTNLIEEFKKKNLESDQKIVKIHRELSESIKDTTYGIRNMNYYNSNVLKYLTEIRDHLQNIVDKNNFDFWNLKNYSNLPIPKFDISYGFSGWFNLYEDVMNFELSNCDDEDEDEDEDDRKNEILRRCLIYYIPKNLIRFYLKIEETDYYSLKTILRKKYYKFLQSRRKRRKRTTN